MAPLLRLDVWPEGSIYPKAERAVRALLRKRSQLVRQRTANLLSIQNLLARQSGVSPSGHRVKQLSATDVDQLMPEADVALAVKSNLAVIQCLEPQIATLGKAIQNRIKLRPAFQALLTVSGIGQVLALTIMLETGDIGRFESVGNCASYCRCVQSNKISKGKRKGQGNVKNGNLCQRQCCAAL